MKPLFFTSTKPKHQYKTEKFFSGYLKTKKVSRFVSGSSKQFSNYKKMLVMKKFFMWYYNIKSWRLFFKVFQLSFLQKRYTFRYLLSLYHLLERNLLVLLIRTKFSFNLIESLYYVKNKFIYVNGHLVTLDFCSTKIGDIVEVFTWQYKYFEKYFPVVLLSRKASTFYYNYYTPLKQFFYISKFYFKKAKNYYKYILKYKYYYSYLYFKILLLNISKPGTFLLPSKSFSFLKFISVHKIQRQFRRNISFLKYSITLRKNLSKKRRLIKKIFRNTALPGQRRKLNKLQNRLRYLTRRFVRKGTIAASLFFAHIFVKRLYSYRRKVFLVNSQLRALKPLLNSPFFKKKKKKKVKPQKSKNVLYGAYGLSKNRVTNNSTNNVKTN